MYAKVPLSPNVPVSFQLPPASLLVPVAWEPEVGWFPRAEPLMEGVGTQEGDVGSVAGRGLSGEGPDADTPNNAGEEPGMEAHER